MTEEEYFYRPALGIFSPSPDGLFDLSDPERQYLDKFGRQFMRTIHTLRITGRDTSGLELILRRKLAEIYNTPLDPLTPEYWTGFNKFTNSCTTLIRDSLREWGYPAVSGIFPLELFINALWLFRKKQQSGEVLISLYRHNQLVVDEAPLSRLSPLLNPLNKIKKILISLSAKEKNLTF
jgi:hypothetical protein